MSSRRFNFVALAVTVLVAVAACESTSPSRPSVDWSKQTSARSGGGMDALVPAAKLEGKLTVIALPPDWANYATIIRTFEAKYGIKVTSLDPNGSRQNAVNAFDGTGRAPDVVDVGLSVVLPNASRFSPYQVAEWDDIPAAAKDANGAWYADYGGYMGIGYDSSKYSISSLSDLLGRQFRSAVALAGDPTTSNQSLNSVMMASVANGGSLDDVSKGVAFFHALKQRGNFVTVAGSDATVKSGQTPVLFEWDYLSASHASSVPHWKIFVPSNAIVGGYYAQAINKQAPHPAAARLWEEFLYSDEAQNLWLKGGVHPVRQPSMTSAGTIDPAAAAALPQVSGMPQILTGEQTSRASAYLHSNWSQAVG